MKLGVLDLGSNSFQLLAADATGPNEVRELAMRRATLCIENALMRINCESEHEQKRALETVGNLIRWARGLDGEMPIIGVGKTGLQDTPQGSAFLQTVQRRYGISVELLTGEAEAKLTYRGVRSRLTEIRERLGVIDIGGGSVEIGVGQRRFCFFGAGLPLGFLRVQGLDRQALRERVETLFADAAKSVRELGPERWQFSGGTSRAFGRVAMALSVMTRGQIEQAQVVALADHVQTLSPHQLGQLGVPQNRVAMFPQAALLLAMLVERFHIPALGISTGGLRQGLVLREYERACFSGLAEKNPRANWDRSF